MPPRITRDYQAAAVDAVKAHWSAGRRRVVVVGPVGSGKTYVAELLIVPILAHKWAQVFFCAHTESLLDQPALRYQDANIRAAFIKAGRDEDADAMLQFCSVLTLVRRDIVPQHRRAVVFIDECHRVKSSSYLAILTNLSRLFEFVYVVYLTATPYRLDGKGLADVADALIEIATPRQLIDAGVLCRPRYYSEPLPEGDTEEVIFRPGIVGDVVSTWKQRAAGLPTICRAYSLDHSKLLAQRFVEAGVRAAHIDGTMSTAQRRRLLVGLSIGGTAATPRHPLALDVLCAGSNIFDEGFDSRASYEMLLPREEVMPYRPDQSDQSFRTIHTPDRANVTKPLLQTTAPWAAAASPRAAWTTLRDSAVVLSPAEATALRRRVLDGVLPELRDFWPEVDSGAPMEPPAYQALCVLCDACPTASKGAWMQRQGRVVRSWRGDDDETIVARSWQGLSWSSPKIEAIVLSHGGNLDRHDALIWHEGFTLDADAKWATKGVGRKAALLIPTLHSVAARLCPQCMCVDVERSGVCAYCGAALAVPNLPKERPDVELVSRPVDAPMVVSTPGTREAYLRARYAEMVSANRERAAAGKPPYSPRWPGVRFYKRFGFWPDHALEAMIKRSMGLR